MLAGVAALALLLVLVFAALVRANVTMRADLTRLTDAVIQEQRIGGRLIRAVSRQLVAGSGFTGPDPAEAYAAFQDAGRDAQTQIRAYLLRDLGIEQRINLEQVKEHHQRLEVSASHAFDLSRRGRAAEAAASAAAMNGHALTLQDALDGFLRLREADLERLRAAQARAFQFQFAGGALIILLLLAMLLLAASFLQRRLADPFAALAAAARRIGAGDLSARVHPAHDDELADVAHAFNRMAEGLAEAAADLERRNLQVQRALEQLRATQAELIQSEKMSATGRMMAGLAHELNNPLASVLGYAELLGTRLGEDPRLSATEARSDFVSPIIAEAGRARELVRNLLRFSRRSEGDLTGVSLAESLRVVVGLRGFAFEQVGLRLLIGDLPECHVRAEPQTLQQVFLNIINNACDAMRPAGAGSLVIHGRREGDDVLLHFDDDGPGLPRPERIFEPFFTTKAVGEGTGLGLALVHRFMQEFGGSIIAENRPEGGARFSLRFTAERAPAAAVTHADPVNGSDIPPEPVPTPARRTRILVVEDEAHLRDLQKRLLSRLHAEVLLASGGHEACRILEHNDVDLVISDIRMPAGSGIDLYRWVEATRPALLRRVVFVTGDVSDPEIARLAEERPHAVLRKPFQMAEYVDWVTTLLA